MKTLEELKNGATITPGEAYKYAAAYMDPVNIDHHETDLYLKVDNVGGRARVSRSREGQAPPPHDLRPAVCGVWQQ